MFDTIFKILYALFLFVAGIIISVRNNIFINRNNNYNSIEKTDNAIIARIGDINSQVFPIPLLF